MTTDLIAISSILISLIALIYAYLSNTKNYELKSQYRTEVLKWYSDTVSILIRLKEQAKSGSPDENLKTELLADLSSKIEIGRFYFPNIDKKNKFGSEKPSAYQGYRNLVLEFLVFSYRLFSKQESEKYLDHADKLQRYFTSLVFEILDPRKYLLETNKLTKHTFSNELNFEDFIKQDPEILRIYMQDN